MPFIPYTGPQMPQATTTAYIYNDYNVGGIGTNTSDIFFDDISLLDESFTLNDIINLLNKNNKLDQVTEYVLIFIFLTVIVLGFFGNSLVIWTVLFNRHMRTSSNIFIINLAVSDLTLCIFSIPFMSYKALKHTWIWGDFMCRFAPFYQATNVYVSTLSITAIALDRYVNIVYSNTVRYSKHRRTRACSNGAIISITIIWLFSFLISAPLFAFSTVRDSSVNIHPSMYYTNITNMQQSESFALEPQHKPFATTTTAKQSSTQQSFVFEPIFHCVENWPMPQARLFYSYTSLLIQYIFPILIVGLAYGRIWLKLKRHRKKLQSYPSANSSTGKRNSKNNSEIELNQKLRINESVEAKRQLFLSPENNSLKKASTLSVNNNNLSTAGSYLSLSSAFQSQSIVNNTVKNKKIKKRLHHNKKYHDRKQLRMNILLIFIAIIFAASWLPLNIFNILSDSKASIIHPSYGFYLLNTICILFAMSSSVSNPFLYGFLNENFKREYVKCFERVRNRFPIICYFNKTIIEIDGTKPSVTNTVTMQNNVSRNIEIGKPTNNMDLPDVDIA